MERQLTAIIQPPIQPVDITKPVLQATDVVAGYAGHQVLNGLNLTVHHGEVFALLGPNGAGKSTTLGLFLGTLSPWAGQVRVGGQAPTGLGAGAPPILAYIPETVALYGELSAHENLDYLLSLAGQAASAQAIQEALDSAGLQSDAHHKRTASFSKGMRQKVAVALALARKVPALLLDEPSSGLDPQAASDLNQLLAQVRASGVAVLLVTHDLLGAAEIADRIGFLEAGRLTRVVNASGKERFDLRSLREQFVSRKGGQTI